MATHQLGNAKQKIGIIASRGVEKVAFPMGAVRLQQILEWIF